MDTVLPGVWDRANTIRVELLSGELESVTELNALQGHNRIIINGEVLGYQTATLVDTLTYDLTVLLRGLRGTEQKIANGIAIGDSVVPLDRGGVNFLPLPPSAIGSPRLYKVVAGGQVLEEVQPVPWTLKGLIIKPFVPTDVRVTLDASNNATLTWKRRSRRITRLFAPALTPREELLEEYQVEFLNGPTPIRSTLPTTETEGYTAAEQTSDGLTPGDPITFKLSQSSDVLTEGKSQVFTL